MNIENAFGIALPIVASKRKNIHYAHVVELSGMYYRPMVTGKDAEHLIKRFNMRESEDAHRQRVRLTELITPSISNTLMAPARKVPKVKPVVDTATFGVEQKEKDEKLNKAVHEFYAGKSVDHYFGSVLIDQGAIDPNGFCLVLFDDARGAYEKPRTYPVIIGSEDAWDYEFLNGELYWLMVHRNIEYTEVQTAEPKKGEAKVTTGNVSKAVKKKGHAFWLYTDQHHLYFTQIDVRSIASQTEGVLMTKDGRAVPPKSVQAASGDAQEVVYYYRPNSKELYEVRAYEHATGMVQGFRLGYVPDQSTKGETCVNLWNAAVPYMLKGIKAGSELDISAALHAFLQKIQYANPCKGSRDPEGNEFECNAGYKPNGDKCPSCGGTGYDAHTSGQDHITLRMPRSKDEAFDLGQLVHYVQMPVDTIKWQDEYVTKLERSCYSAVYNSDRFRDPSANTTATGDIIDLQSVYDALKPLADWYSQNRVRVYKLVASFEVGKESLKTLDIAHEFPRNMRFETLSERVKLLGEMRTAGASASALAQVNEDILEDLYVDDPAALKKAKVMASFDPFVGKSEASIVSMISQDLTTKENKVLWTNFGYVFAEAEERASEKKDEKGNPVNFYDMARPAQQELVEEIVAELLEAMEDESSANEPLIPGMGEGEEGGEEGNGQGAGAPQGGSGEGDELPDSPGNTATA
jgi:hypothetical protein